MLNVQNVLSNLSEAFKDDTNNVCLYNDPTINMECIKPDDLTEHFLKYMKTKRNVVDFKQEEAVDALCIDKQNNFFIIEFTRQHVTYIIVVSSKKNPKEYQRIRLSKAMGNEYTPNIYKKYKGYYLKDVFMMTELELPQFIDKFAVCYQIMSNMKNRQNSIFSRGCIVAYDGIKLLS